MATIDGRELPANNIVNDETLGVLSAIHKLHSTSPRELWLVFVIKFLESFAYFSTSLSMTIFFSSDHGVASLLPADILSLPAPRVRSYRRRGRVAIWDARSAHQCVWPFVWRSHRYPF